MDSERAIGQLRALSCSRYEAAAPPLPHRHRPRPPSAHPIKDWSTATGSVSTEVYFWIALGAPRILVTRGPHDLNHLCAWEHCVRSSKWLVSLPKAPDEALLVLRRYGAFLVEADGPRLSIDLGANSSELARKWFANLVRLHAVAVDGQHDQDFVGALDPACIKQKHLKDPPIVAAAVPEDRPLPAFLMRSPSSTRPLSIYSLRSGMRKLTFRLSPHLAARSTSSALVSATGDEDAPDKMCRFWTSAHGWNRARHQPRED